MNWLFCVTFFDSLRPEEISSGLSVFWGLQRRSAFNGSERLLERGAVFHAARTLHVPPELLDFKFRLMNRRGYHLPLPLNAKSTFLQHLGRGGQF